MDPLEWVRAPCGESSHCIEVADDGGDLVRLRNATDGFTVSRGEWDAFRDAVKEGVFG